MIDKGVVDLIALPPLLIAYAITYPLYLRYTYSKIQGWRLYNIFIHLMLATTTAIVGYRLEDQLLEAIALAYLAVTLTLQLKNLSLNQHLALVETYTIATTILVSTHIITT